MKLLPHFKVTIGAKLEALIGILLLVSVTTLVTLSVGRFVDSNTALIQQMNADTANSLSVQMRQIFETLTVQMRVIGVSLLQNFSELSTSEYFKNDPDFLAVFLNEHRTLGTFNVTSRAISPQLTDLGDITGDNVLKEMNSKKGHWIDLAAKGEVQIFGVPLADGSPTLAVIIPFVERDKGGFSHTLTGLIRPSKFMATFTENDLTTSFMIDRHGRLLAHPELNRVSINEDMSSLEITREMLAGKFNNRQMSYLDPNTGKSNLGAYRMVGFGGLGVVTQVPEEKAYEGVQDVVRRATYFAIIILSIAFLFGYFYSNSLTRPIKEMSFAAIRITNGDFKIDLKYKGNDELAHLSKTFNEMARGLEERDRVKETFSRFHNKEIAEKLLSGEVKLGGERKNATVFFSDIRGFTALSESMEPEEVVDMLNEYMTRMVSIIRTYSGVVDKYIGDAIMALWGVPISNPEDNFNAIRACLEMRIELDRLNQVRLSRGQAVLKIGMGLNRGPVIAGNIGSNEKMEYTVIGDAVNLASRIESMTKSYGTDLLISREIYEAVNRHFIFEECKSSMVKGKRSAIEVFKVLGYIDESNKSILIKTPYSSYEAERSDKIIDDSHREEDPTRSGIFIFKQDDIAQIELSTSEAMTNEPILQKLDRGNPPSPPPPFISKQILPPPPPAAIRASALKPNSPEPIAPTVPVPPPTTFKKAA